MIIRDFVKTVLIGTVDNAELETFITKMIDAFPSNVVTKDPALLQHIGVGFRELYGSDVWVNIVAAQIRALTCEDPSVNIIVTDMRFENEMAALKDLGFATVKITRSARVIDRDPNHISETALALAQFDYHIPNEGTFDDYILSIDVLAQELSAHGDAHDGLDIAASM
jgi:hypothetical protein